jgi:hypothetical protein
MENVSLRCGVYDAPLPIRAKGGGLRAKAPGTGEKPAATNIADAVEIWAELGLE